MSETRTRTADRLIATLIVEACKEARKGFPECEPVPCVVKARDELMAFCTETPDIPTPEPVAVDDITPGWYWVLDENHEPDMRGHKQPLSHLYVATESTKDSPFDSSRTWYRAPSPSAILQMCREVVTAEEVPPVIDDVAPPDMCHPVLQSLPTVECADIPPAVEVALTVLSGDLTLTGGRLLMNAENVVANYLGESLPDEGQSDEPAAIETCGECGTYNETSPGFGKCEAAQRLGNFSSWELVGQCTLATPKAEVAP